MLQAHKDQEKDVVRAAEACAATMAGVLPTEMVVRVLNPIVKTGDFPVNQAAIKMLTKLVERQSPDSIEPHLSELMPGLLKVITYLFFLLVFVSNRSKLCIQQIKSLSVFFIAGLR